MDKHTLSNRPTPTFDGATGLRLAPPGLLQVDRWKHLTEAPVMAKTSPAQLHAREDN